jgi:hypothetical protein
MFCFYYANLDPEPTEGLHQCEVWYNATYLVAWLGGSSGV